MIPRSCAVMQPYIFPYIGYFQLLYASDQFVFYDDVNYIKRGWINRNNILIDGGVYKFTIPVQAASQNKKINQIQLFNVLEFKDQFLKKIKYAYKKAPYYNSVQNVIAHTLECEVSTISDLAINSINNVLSYLNITLNTTKSSLIFSNSVHLKKEERLIHICNQLNCKTYINSIGGEKLYDKDVFKKRDINLLFLKTLPKSYKQFSTTKEFASNLSIIDVLMFNEPKFVCDLLKLFILI